MGKKSIFLTESAWLMSIITAVLSFIALFIFAHLFGAMGMEDKWIGLAVGGLYGIMVVFACFMICKYHPKSIWNSIILCNVTAIFPATGDETFWSSNLWILFVGIWTASIVGGIIGVVIGKQHT